MEFRSFDPSSMQHALDELIEHRWALRSLFVWREQDRARLVTLNRLESLLLQVEYADADKLLSEDRKKGFLLDQESPIRITYALDRDGGALCILTFHHAAVDGWSIAILANELLRLYSAFLNKTALPVFQTDAKPPVRSNLISVETWREYLQELPDPTPLRDLFQPQSQSVAYAQQGIQLSPEETAAVNRWCKVERVTLSSLVHCVWGMTLGYLSGRETSVFGSIDSGRRHLDGGEVAVGMFMTLLPIKVAASETLQLGEFVRRFQSQYWELLQHLSLIHI